MLKEDGAFFACVIYNVVARVLGIGMIMLLRICSRRCYGDTRSSSWRARVTLHNRVSVVRGDETKNVDGIGNRAEPVAKRCVMRLGNMKTWSVI
jgi:hypothetical protein